jgi:hypothetical protein
MIFPIQLVWHLQMARGQKIAVIVLFASGVVCIAFATIRVVQIGIRAGNHTSPSPTWLALWTIVESAIAICIGCCPAFAVLYRTTRAASMRHNTDGYIRHDHSRSGEARSRTDAIQMQPMATSTSRPRTTKLGMYWDDTTSSQEELAGETKGITVTTTLQQASSHSSESASVHPQHDLRSSFVAISPTLPLRTVTLL